MTTSIKQTRRVQLGRETTAGTAVAATTIWRGPGISAFDERVKVRPDENAGVSARTTRQYTPQLRAGLTLPSTELTFEQILHPLEAGVKTASVQTDTGGSGKIRVYTLQHLTTPPTIKTYTLEAGNDQAEHDLEYCFATELTMAGKTGEAWRMESMWRGRQLTEASFTSPLSIPAVEEAMFETSKVYIDNVSGNFGSTQLQATVISAELKLTTGWQARHTADGQLYFNHPEWVGVSGFLTLRMLHNADTETEYDLYKSDTPRLVRVKLEGSNLTTAGATYSKKTILVDVAGVWTSFSSPNEDDGGANIVTAVLGLGYDPTKAQLGAITVVNQLATVP